MSQREAGDGASRGIFDAESMVGQFRVIRALGMLFAGGSSTRPPSWGVTAS